MSPDFSLAASSFSTAYSLRNPGRGFGRPIVHGRIRRGGLYRQLGRPREAFSRRRPRSEEQWTAHGDILKSESPINDTPVTEKHALTEPVSSTTRPMQRRSTLFLFIAPKEKTSPFSIHHVLFYLSHMREKIVSPLCNEGNDRNYKAITILSILLVITFDRKLFDLFQVSPLNIR